MNKEEVQATVLKVLGQIAPEADLTAINSDKNLRDQLDIDSMDFLNFLIAIDRELKVDIPERDYGKLGTLNACVDYIVARRKTR